MRRRVGKKARHEFFRSSHADVSRADIEAVEGIIDRGIDLSLGGGVTANIHDWIEWSVYGNSTNVQPRGKVSAVL